MSSYTCPKCGSMVYTSWHYCPFCGKDLIEGREWAMREVGAEYGVSQKTYRAKPVEDVNA